MRSLPHKKLKERVFLILATPAVITSMINGPIAGFLPGIYAKYYGVDLVVVGMVIMIVRILDGVTDPVLGYLSDNTNSRFGPRKTWIAAGTLLALPCIFFLFRPPEQVSTVYFLTWYLLFYLAWTMKEIPIQAWAAELSGDSTERNRIFMYRALFGLFGGIIFAAMPMLPIFSSTSMTPEVLGFMAWVILIVLPLSIAAALFFVPQGQAIPAGHSSKLTELYRAFRFNKPLWLLIGAGMLGGLAFGMYSGLWFIYFDTYLGIGDKVVFMTLAGVLSGIISMPVWYKILSRFEKHRVWAVNMAAMAVVFLLIGFIPTGPAAFLPYMVLSALTGLMMSCAAVAMPSLFADVIDYDALKTRQNRAGSYMSLSALTTKINVALGTGFSLWIAGLFSYDATATTHQPFEVFGLKFAALYLPFALILIGSILIWKFPIDSRKRAIIRRRLESRGEQSD